VSSMMTNVMLFNDIWQGFVFLFYIKIDLYINRRINMNTSTTIFQSFKQYAVALVFLGLINLITSPNTLWVIWPALGMGIALLSEVLGISSSKKVS